jgi:hypothetical protein
MRQPEVEIMKKNTKTFLLTFILIFLVSCGPGKLSFEIGLAGPGTTIKVIHEKASPSVWVALLKCQEELGNAARAYSKGELKKEAFDSIVASYDKMIEMIANSLKAPKGSMGVLSDSGLIKIIQEWKSNAEKVLREI